MGRSFDTGVRILTFLDVTWLLDLHEPSSKRGSLSLLLSRVVYRTKRSGVLLLSQFGVGLMTVYP